MSCYFVFFRQEKFDSSIIRVYQKDEVAIYQSPGDGRCVFHSVIRSMRDQGLKATPTTDNLIDMVISTFMEHLSMQKKLTSLKNWSGMKIFKKTSLLVNIN